MKLERGCVPPAGAKIHDSAVCRSATLRAMTSDNQRGSGRLVGVIGWWKSRVDAWGIATGLLFWWFALPPTLIPRGWIVQAATSAVCLALGYGIGTLIRRALRGIGGPSPLPSAGVRIGLAIAWAAVLVAGVVMFPIWQNQARALVAMPLLGWWEGVPMALASLPLGAALVWIGHRIADGLGALNRFNHRFLPGWLAAPATILLLLVALWFVGGRFIGGALVGAMNATYGAIDDTTNEGTVQPTVATVAGGPGSLVAWDTLGRWGRDFVANVTTRDELVAFHGADADLVDPVRVYVGLRSTDGGAREQADLAVRELERVGGFDRSVLVVWTATGSGWMDPDGTEALEQVWGGDTAIVTIQYSFLPSFFSLIVDEGKAAEAGAVLFDAVHEHWAQLPPDARPKLIVFGLSLGTLGAEAPFAAADAASSVGNMAARVDGALIVGSKRDNTIVRQLTRERDPGSPAWQPVIDGGATVRFIDGDPAAAGLDAGWQSPRIAYLQYPTDPVTYWGLDDFWSPPEWMDQPRGRDVSPAAGWFPVMSGVTALADLAFQLSPPPGHGHDYATSYVDAWSRVVTPDGWTDADTDRLETFLHP